MKDISTFKEKEAISIQLDEKVKTSVRQPLYVYMKDKKGTEIQLELYDGLVVEMGEGITYISGKVYDVFR